MKLSRLPILLAIAAITLLSRPTLTLAGEKHLFLLIGQSNMAGRATIEDVDREPLEGVYLWNIGEEKWEPATPPYNRYSPSRKDMKMQRLNCGPSFAKAWLAAHPGVEIGIVCSARGGSAIGQWEKGNGDQFDLYHHAIEAARKAAATGGTWQGILWHQGESDSKEFSQYPKKLRELVENLRHDLEEPEIPFIFSQVGEWNKDYEPFNQMIVNQPAQIPHSACVETGGLTNFDVAHFDSPSQRELGRRYAAILLEIRKKPAG